jgi:ParB/RepB/Spo0J family partition protein
MTGKHVSKALMVSVDDLIVPEEYQTKALKVNDEILQNSMRLTGVQQPLIVISPDGKRYYIVDGVRRFNVARSLGIEELPCVIDHGVEDVVDRDEYRNRIRFILDEHRQDLLPTQRAKLIKQLQKTFGMTSRQVGLYLGVTSGTIANWMLIEKVIPEIQETIDHGDLKIHTARAFAAMTEEGQRQVWEKHSDAATTLSGERLHRWIRDKYPPDANGEMYVAPDKVIKQLNREDKGRKGKKRTAVSDHKKSSLEKDLEAKKLEIEDKKAQIAGLEEDINATIPVVEALCDDDELWAAIPESIQSDLEEFAERYLT